MGATHRWNESQNPEAGFTELSEQKSGSTEGHAASAMWKIGEDTSPTIDAANLTKWVSTACEIKAAAGGAGILSSLLHRNQMRHMLNR